MGILTQNDANIFKGFFKEMAKLRGIKVIYQYPIDMNMSIYGEENPKSYSEPILMDIIFEQNPKVSTLRKYGWVSEINEDKPFLMTLPYDAKNLCKGCRVTIKPYNDIETPRIFVITEIHSNLEFPDSWVCKVAPVYKGKNLEQPTYETTNYNYVKEEKSPIRTENNYSYIKVKK